MSLTVNSRPATWAGTSNPIIYNMTTTDHGNAGYYLLVEVWNSTTALKIGSARYYPNSAGVINVRVEAFLKSNMSLDNNSDLTSGSVYLDNNWIKYYIKYQQFWTGSSTSQTSDSGNLRYAVYGGLQIGVINDMTLYVDGVHKLLALSSDFAIIGFPFLIESIFTSSGNFIVSRYLRGQEISCNYYSASSIGINRLKIKEVNNADKFTIWKENGAIGSFTTSNATPSNTFKSVAHGKNLFVGVSSDGTNRVITSPDGITWTQRAISFSTQWGAICFGNGIFVATDIGGFGGVMVSSDGITWDFYSDVVPSVTNVWNSVCFGNGIFVAVSNSISAVGTGVMTSSDGINWTIRTTPVDNDWNSVCFGNGLFIAVAANGTDVITSPDGITWTARNHGIANEWVSIVWGAGLFVAISRTGTGNRVMTSPDGITWTSRTSAGDFSWTSIAYFSGIFIAVGKTGTAGQRMMFSKDGITWSLKSAPTTNDWECVCAAQSGSQLGKFVALSSTGSGNRACYGLLIQSEFKQITILSELSNTVMLQWKNSLGGDECYPFTYNQEYTFDYGGGKKAKRLTLFAHGLTLNQWEAINGLNTLGEPYKTHINEMTTSLNRTMATIGQSVYILNSDGTKIGVTVINVTNTTTTKKVQHEATVTIEYPEIILQ